MGTPISNGQHHSPDPTGSSTPQNVPGSKNHSTGSSGGQQHSLTPTQILTSPEIPGSMKMHSTDSSGGLLYSNSVSISRGQTHSLTPTRSGAQSSTPQKIPGSMTVHSTGTSEATSRQATRTSTPAMPSSTSHSTFAPSSGTISHPSTILFQSSISGKVFSPLSSTSGPSETLHSTSGSTTGSSYLEHRSLTSTSGPSATSHLTSGSNAESSDLEHGDSSVTAAPESTSPSGAVSANPTSTTSVAAIIFPVLFDGLYKNRKNILNNDKDKTDYIRDIENTKNHIQSFLDTLPDQTIINDVGCSEMKRKRSLISDIAGIVGNIGKLVGCGGKILDNLKKIVETGPPNMDEVDDLTKAIKTIGDDIQNDTDNNNHSSRTQSKSDSASHSTSYSTSTSHSTSHSTSKSTSHSTSHSTSESSCTQTAVPICTATITLSTSFFRCKTGSTVHTKSATKCDTITACSRSATTVTTTIWDTASTSTSSCTQTAVPICTETVTLSTSFFRCKTGSTVRRSTATKCDTITACSRSATTVTTTVSETASTSRSTCTKTAVPICTETVSLSTSYFSSKKGSTVHTSTATKCETITVCSRSATTVTTTVSKTSPPTKTPPIYLIFRNLDIKDEAVTSNFTQELEYQLGPKNFSPLKHATLGIIFWAARLNSSQITEFNKSSIVSDIMLDDIVKVDIADNITSKAQPSKPSKRDDIVQPNSLRDLKVISQPHDIPDVNQAGDYKYDSTAGSGVTVYVVDTGANPSHPEYRFMPGNKRWMFPDGAPRFTLPPEEIDLSQSDYLDHGSCSLSKVAGPTFGVAKKVDVVIVKLPQIILDNIGLQISSILDIWIEIDNDIRARQLQGKAVITYSARVHARSKRAAFPKAFEEIVRAMIANDVPMICAAGNGGFREHIRHYPAALASEIDGLIAVGSTNLNGRLSSFSQSEQFVTVYAPGEDIMCATNNKQVSTPGSGTSISGASVAGLAAYFLSLDEYRKRLQHPGQVAKNVEDIIKSLAYPRIEGGLPILYNGKGGDGCAMDIGRRDGTSVGACRSISQQTSTSRSSIASGTTTSSKKKPTSKKTTASKTEAPTTSTKGPTNVPGKGGLPGCAAVMSVHGTSAYCNCGGTAAPTLKPTRDGTINCDYTIQPTSAYNPKIPETSKPTTSTKPKIPRPTGQCNVHVKQYLGMNWDEDQMLMEVTISGMSGEQLGYLYTSLQWGDTIKVQGKLPWLLLVTPHTGVSNDDGRGHPDTLTRPLYEQGPVNFAYGSQAWDTTFERCSVGEWDNSAENDIGVSSDSPKPMANRQMDCKFNCP